MNNIKGDTTVQVQKHGAEFSLAAEIGATVLNHYTEVEHGQSLSRF